MASIFFGWLDLSGNNNNLKIPDSAHKSRPLVLQLKFNRQTCCPFWRFSKAQKFGMGFFWGVHFWSRDFLWVLLKALVFFGGEGVIFSPIRSSRLCLEIRSIPPGQKPFPLARHIPIWLIYGSNRPPSSGKKAPTPTKYLREIV